MNMMLICYKNRAVMIDCGIMFPDGPTLGVDIILPNIEFIRDSKIKIDGIVLTHGHEDHIGATAHLYEALGRPPLYGTPFTLSLVQDRMKERGNLSKAKFHPIKPPKRFKVGQFGFKGIQVTHSIVDSMGLVIETPVGDIVHSGDFKIEYDPISGKGFDDKSLKEIGKTKPLLMLVDSTNVERPGWSTPEHKVGAGLLKEFKKVKSGKIIVCLFSSNVHRIQVLLDAAKAVGRQVAFCGRSMLSNIENGKKHRFLKYNPKQIIPPNQVSKMPRDKVVVLSTGTQAEPRSALYRMSVNNHRDIKIEPGDTVMMSSREIPGNEKAISHMVNNIYRRGAKLIHPNDVLIHATGHAQQEEQKQILKWVKPKFFLPVHGEYRMLVKHLEMAKKTLKGLEGIVIENGDVVQLTKDSIKKISRVPNGKIFMDEGSTDLHDGLLRDRKKLAYAGLVVVSIVVDRDKGRILEGPEFDIRGVNDEVDLKALEGLLKDRFEELSKDARGDQYELEEEFRVLTRRFFRKANGIKPVVIPVIYEL
jgi:ribonuclease J